MVKLYRVLKQQPVILTPDVRANKSKGFLDFFGGPQDFCDDETKAREFAGEKGFIMRIELPEDVAKKYYKGAMEIILSADKSTIVHEIGRHEITGIELAQHINEWNYSSISMQEGNSFKEKR